MRRTPRETTKTKPSHRAVARVLALGFVLLAGAAGSMALLARWIGPVWAFPGGSLSGPVVTEPVEDWGFIDEIDVIQLEVSPERPHSVNTWIVLLEGTPHVAADFLTPNKQWPHLAVEDPRVRLRVGGRIYPRIARRVSDPEAIQALRSEVERKYGGQNSLRVAVETWFFRILYRKALNHRRWRALRVPFDGDVDTAVADASRLDRAADAEIARRIDGALSRLSAPQRGAFVLVHLEGFTTAEAADLMGKAHGTVKSHLHRALRQLRDHLADLNPGARTR